MVATSASAWATVDVVVAERSRLGAEQVEGADDVCRAAASGWRRSRGNPASTATGANSASGRCAVARSWLTTGWPLWKQSRHGPSADCSSNSSTTRMASLDEVISCSWPSGPASMIPAAGDVEDLDAAVGQRA